MDHFAGMASAHFGSGPPACRDRDCQRTRRPLAPGFPRSHNRRAMPGTACSAHDQFLQQSASSDALQNRRESYRANHFKQRVFTQPGPQADSCTAPREHSAQQTMDPMHLRDFGSDRPRRPIQKAPRLARRSGGRLRDAFDDLEVGRQCLAPGFRPEQHGDHD
jgi:hypothetical protein